MLPWQVKGFESNHIVTVVRAQWDVTKMEEKTQLHSHYLQLPRRLEHVFLTWEDFCCLLGPPCICLGVRLSVRETSNRTMWCAPSVRPLRHYPPACYVPTTHSSRGPWNNMRVEREDWRRLYHRRVRFSPSCSWVSSVWTFAIHASN